MDQTLCQIRAIIGFFQVDPAKYRNPIFGWRLSVAEGGLKSLTLGWAPIAIGFSLQGLAKFGLYEVLKLYYTGLLGNVRHQMKHYINTCLIIVGP